LLGHDDFVNCPVYLSTGFVEDAQRKEASEGATPPASFFVIGFLR
jgi:hypothetical protein